MQARLDAAFQISASERHALSAGKVPWRLAWYGRRVRAQTGEARTVRTWNIGYGEVYNLWADLHLGGESYCVFGRLDELVVEGPFACCW